MSLEPSEFTNQEWVNYTTYQTSAWVMAIFGSILLIVGYRWGTQALAPAVKETSNGITIVEGAATMGVFYGPGMAVIGLMILLFAQYPIQQAKRVRWYDRRMP